MKNFVFDIPNFNPAETNTRPEDFAGNCCGDALANYLNAGPLKDTGQVLPRGGIGPGELAKVGASMGSGVYKKNDLTIDNIAPGMVIHMTRQPEDKNYEHGKTHVGMVDIDAQGNKVFRSYTAGKGWSTQQINQNFINRLPSKITATNPVNPELTPPRSELRAAKIAGSTGSIGPIFDIPNFKPEGQVFNIGEEPTPQTPQAPPVETSPKVGTIPNPLAGEAQEQAQGGGGVGSYPGIMGMQDTPPEFIEKRASRSTDSIPENLKPLNVLKKVLTPPSIDEINRGMADLFQPGGYDRLNEKAANQLASPEAAIFAALDPMIAVAGLGGIKESTPVVRAVESPQLKTLGKVVTGAGEKYNPGEIKKLQALAKNEFGIDLTVPELTNSPTLRSLWTRLAKTPGPQAEKLANYIEEVRSPQIAAAIEQELKGISPSGLTGWQAGGQARVAAQRIEESLKTERQMATRPMYKAAFKSAEPIDITPVLEDVQQIITKYPEGHPSRAALQQVERMLTKTDETPVITRAKASAKTDAYAEEFDRGKILREFGGFNSQSSILKNFPPSERRKLQPYLRKNAQGADELLDEVKGNYPHLFAEYENDHDLLRAIIDGKLKKPVDLEKMYAQAEREAIQSEKSLMANDPWAMVSNQSALPINAIDDLETMHHAKVGIDQLLQKAKQDKSIDNDTRRVLTGIKAKLQGIMERDNPLYGRAQQTYRLLSRPLNDFRYGTPNLQPRDPHVKTMIARVADLGPEKVEQIPNLVFSGNPQEIARTKAYFNKAYPGTWDAMTRSYLQGKLDRIKDTVIEREGNIGSVFERTVFNDQASRDKLRSALDKQQYYRLKQFMKILDKTRRIIYTNSETAFQMEAGKILERGGASEILEKIPTNKFGVLKWVAGKFDKLQNPQFADRLADSLLNGNNAVEINKIAKMPDSPTKALKTAILVEQISIKGSSVPGGID